MCHLCLTFKFILSHILLQKIKKWFYNHYSNPRREYMKFTRKWSARSAFHQLNREEVLELARQESGLVPGHPQFLGALQRATTSLWDALSPEDVADYVKAAKEWSAESPPSHIQSRWAIVDIISHVTLLIPSYRMASSMRKRVIQDFQHQLYKTCGIRSLVLTAYEGEDNNLKIGMWVIWTYLWTAY